MPYPENFLRLVVAGSGDGNERWSWSLSLHTLDGSTDEPNVDQVPAAIVDAVADFHQVTSSGRAWIDSIKLNEIGPDGRYVRAQTVETVLTGTSRIQGEAGASSMPAQVSLAVSLRTDVERGLAAKGRFFIPYPPNAVGSNGYIDQSVAAARAGYAKTMIDQINAAGAYDVVVASSTRTGAFRRVQSVAVGNRYDIIRSRGKSLPETYSTAVIAGSPT